MVVVSVAVVAHEEEPQSGGEGVVDGMLNRRLEVCIRSMGSVEFVGFGSTITCLERSESILIYKIFCYEDDKNKVVNYGSANFPFMHRSRLRSRTIQCGNPRR